MTSHQELTALLAQRSVRRGHFTLASGKTSEFYVDARITSMSPEGLSLIGPAGLQAIRATGWVVDAIGGLTLGADPIAYAISYASSLHPPSMRAFTVRKETKTHGTSQLIEGPFQKQDAANPVMSADAAATFHDPILNQEVKWMEKDVLLDAGLCVAERELDTEGRVYSRSEFQFR